MGFLVIGCFWGRPQLYFIAGLAGLVSLQGASRVGKGTSSLFNSASTSSLSSLVGASSSSGLML